MLERTSGMPVAVALATPLGESSVLVTPIGMGIMGVVEFSVDDDDESAVFEAPADPSVVVARRGTTPVDVAGAVMLLAWSASAVAVFETSALEVSLLESVAAVDKAEFAEAVELPPPRMAVRPTVRPLSVLELDV